MINPASVLEGLSPTLLVCVRTRRDPTHDFLSLSFGLLTSFLLDYSVENLIYMLFCVDPLMK